MAAIVCGTLHGSISIDAAPVDTNGAVVPTGGDFKGIALDAASDFAPYLRASSSLDAFRRSDAVRRRSVQLRPVLLQGKERCGSVGLMQSYVAARVPLGTGSLGSGGQEPGQSRH